jgi:hypothetical protein
VKALHPRSLLLSLAAAMALWLVFTWPLPLYPFDGIPSSSQNIELDAVRRMIPGDHLQLLYYYELVRGMLFGDVPWFHDLYQFNTGDDAARFWPYAYFAPFSLVYAVAAQIGGPAFGMQVTGFLALWLTIPFTAALLRRFGVEARVAWPAALLAVALPFRWYLHLNASPGGFALLYVPLIAWGLDVAVRDRRWTGGWTAGIGILLLCWGDVQIFALMGVSLPFWCLLSWVDAGRPLRSIPGDTPRWLLALLPTFLLIALAFGYRAALQPYLGDSGMAHGRTLPEIALYSPHWQGLFSWADFGKENHIYFGFLPAAVLGAGTIVGLLRPGRRIVFALLAAAILGLIALSLGTNGPADALLLRGVRKVVPGFDMIRQPARVFYGVMPTLLALTFGLCMTLLPRRLRMPAALCLAVAIAAEYKHQVRATVCTLDREQAAYAAIAADAARDGAVPRLLAVPLWPGDADWSSLYQVYAPLYDIRMINGYSPMVSQAYLDDVFRRFESVNLGLLDDAQLDNLLARGIRYLVLHENAFPDKVSPFPVATTLCRFLDHPRLDPLEQDGPVWAFKLRDTPEPRQGLARYSFFPARNVEFELADERIETSPVEDAAASGGMYVPIGHRGAYVKTRAWKVGPVPRLRWELRVRGQGTLRVVHRANGAVFAHQPMEVASEDWTWEPTFLDALPAFAPVEMELYYEAGAVDVDAAYLTAGRWPPRNPGQQRILPAAAFFHGGYSDMESGRVYLRRDTEPDDVILYGPLLPVEPGTYQVDMLFGAGMDPNVHLGELRASVGTATTPCFPVVTGQPATGTLIVNQNLPLRLEFVYSRAADMFIQEIRLVRMPEDESADSP